MGCLQLNERANKVDSLSPTEVVGFGNSEGIKLQSQSSWGIGKNTHTPDQVCQILTHEFTHYVEFSLAKNEIPLWFNEGVAVYTAMQNKEYLVRDAHKSGKLILLEKLDKKWYDNPDLAYAEAGSFVKFLVSNYKGSLSEVFQGLKSGKF